MIADASARSRGDVSLKNGLRTRSEEAVQQNVAKLALHLAESLSAGNTRVEGTPRHRRGYLTNWQGDTRKTSSVAVTPTASQTRRLRPWRDLGDILKANAGELGPSTAMSWTSGRRQSLPTDEPAEERLPDLRWAGCGCPVRRSGRTLGLWESLSLASARPRSIISERATRLSVATPTSGRSARLTFGSAVPRGHSWQMIPRASACIQASAYEAALMPTPRQPLGWLVLTGPHGAQARRTWRRLFRTTVLNSGRPVFFVHVPRPARRPAFNVLAQ